MIQENLSLNEYIEPSATNWTGRCSLKWRLYNSEHPHGSCGFSEPSMLFSITGVQPRKLRVKDWRNAYGKVGIIGCHFSSPLYGNDESKRKSYLSRYPSVCDHLATLRVLRVILRVISSGGLTMKDVVSRASAQFIFTIMTLTIFSTLELFSMNFTGHKISKSKEIYNTKLLF